MLVMSWYEDQCFYLRIVYIGKVFLAKLSTILRHCLIAMARLGLCDRGRIITQGGQGKYIVFCPSSDAVADIIVLNFTNGNTALWIVYIGEVC